MATYILATHCSGCAGRTNPCDCSISGTPPEGSGFSPSTITQSVTATCTGYTYDFTFSVDGTPSTTGKRLIITTDAGSTDFGCVYALGSPATGSVSVPIGTSNISAAITDCGAAGASWTLSAAWSAAP